MKLKNLLIASLALLSFASCSKDDTVEPEKPVVPVDAVISFLTKADLKTKAEEGKDNENFVRTLDAYVFNDAGTLLGRSHVTATGDQTLTQIDSILIKVVPGKGGAPSTEKFKLVVLANVKDPSVNSLSELSTKALTDSISKYTIGANLPMNSKVITFENVKPSVKDASGKYTTNNWVDDAGSVRSTATEGSSADKEIKLNRMVARVQVESITMDIADRYPDATFKLDTISMVNVRTHATLPRDGSLGAVGIGSDFVKGYQSMNFTAGTAEKPGVIKEPSALVPSLCKSGYSFSWVGGNGNIFDDSQKDLNAKNFCCYIFPNEEEATYKTALLISGYFKRYANDTPSLKHYMVSLSDNNGANVRVLANNIYKLEIKLNGEGSTDENHPEITAGVSVKIEVAPWNVIDQVEEDKN